MHHLDVVAELEKSVKSMAMRQFALPKSADGLIRVDDIIRYNQR